MGLFGATNYIDTLPTYLVVDIMQLVPCMMQQAEVTTGTSAEYKDMLSELLTVESFLRDYQVCLSVHLSVLLTVCSICISVCVCVSVCLSVCLFARCVPHFRQHYVCVHMSVSVCLYTVTCYIYVHVHT